jgi:hypothetical protein
MAETQTASVGGTEWNPGGAVEVDQTEVGGLAWVGDCLSLQEKLQSGNADSLIELNLIKTLHKMKDILPKGKKLNIVHTRAHSNIFINEVADQAANEAVQRGRELEGGGRVGSKQNGVLVLQAPPVSHTELNNKLKSNRVRQLRQTVRDRKPDSLYNSIIGGDSGEHSAKKFRHFLAGFSRVVQGKIVRALTFGDPRINVQSVEWDARWKFLADFVIRHW